MKSVLTSAPGRVCLTFDLRTSIATDGYVCVTAHFIDTNWVLQKKVLNFCHMPPPPHNGVSSFEKVYKLLSMWGIENKIFCVMLDNASSNDVSIDMLRTQLINKKALVHEKLFAMFGEYVSNVPTPSTSSGMAGQAT
ncbi:hypothetical protein SO802_025684 [Lithocarpus litseifolius]|uniref:AC transposase n=1 Tax=Lithocarpus litseifolius TaxID=425828 RepID=A0AAW2BXQ8_9ROSI